MLKPLNQINRKLFAFLFFKEMCMSVTCMQELVEVRRGALGTMAFQMVVSLHKVLGSESGYSTRAVVLLIVNFCFLCIFYFLTLNVNHLD